ncbi:MAG TPA: twin-arginine translocation signal domain-containing protein [Gemmatimonadaceae bacterium]|nr:twin-arginine translocation signal domain-containing protein [Gemmatimonadaceae bacterium]
MTSDRRDFLKHASMAAAAVVVSGGANAARAQPRDSRTLNPTLLTALADAVLPDSLGTTGRAHAGHSFAGWLAGYKPVSEEMHGYGNQEITYTASDPAPGWNAQLEGMDTLARRRYRRGFAALAVAARRDLIRSQLERHRGSALPANPLAATHVAIALLAHWADSSEATDLVYGAQIAKDHCRVLSDSPRKPLPLAPRGTP